MKIESYALARLAGDRGHSDPFDREALRGGFHVFRLLLPRGSLAIRVRAFRARVRAREREG